jgi:hypothetical protein
VNSHEQRSARRGERGASMIFTLLSLSMVTVLGLTLTSVGMSTLAMATAESETTEALAIADAGIEHGKQLVLWQDWASLNVFLQRGDGQGCSFDELAGQPLGTVPADYPSEAVHFIPQTGRAFGQGRYFVQICDNHVRESALPAPNTNTNPNADVDRTVRLRSVGFGPRGSRAAVELMLGPAAMPAVVVNGNLEVKGNPEITGPAGSIHANGTLSLSGNPCTHVYFASTDNTTGSGNVRGGATCTAGAVDSRPYSQPMNVPELTPYQLAVQISRELLKFPFKAEPMPVYTLMANGSAFRGLPAGVAADGTAVAATLQGPLASPPRGWTHQAGQWRTGGDTEDATYYVVGNVNIGANTSGGGVQRTNNNSPFYIKPGDFIKLPPSLRDPTVDPDQNPNNGPWVFMTILAEGWIQADGNPSISPAAEPTMHGRVVMVSALDVDLGATFNSAYDGLFYARQQIEVQGSPTVNGQVIALNKGDDPSPYNGQNLVPLKGGVMVMSGNPRINYGGNGLQAVKALTWRECRGTGTGATFAGGVMTSPGTPCGPP